jgi:hypothetical protein
MTRLAILSLLGACGPGPAYTTRHGMAVYIESEKLPAERDFAPLEAALDIAVDHLERHAPRDELAALLGKSELHLYSRMVECDGERKWACYAEGGRINAVGWTDCPTEWLLHHEMVHMAQEASGHEQSHREPWFGDGSLEGGLRDAIRAEVRACDRVPVY